MNLGWRGSALIKSFEVLNLTSYEDSTGTWTIGWGHTRGVRPGMTITERTAEELFAEDAEHAQSAVLALGIPLLQSQFDALVSLVFNVGPGAISGRSTIGRALRAGDRLAAWRGFTLWIATRGAEFGLARRRTAEMALFLADGPHP